jgi:hypothetical protein
MSSSAPLPDPDDSSYDLAQQDEDLSPVLPVPLVAPVAADPGDDSILVIAAEDEESEVQDAVPLGETLASAAPAPSHPPLLDLSPLDLPTLDATHSHNKEKAAAVLAAILVHVLLALALGVLIVVVPGPPTSEITAIAAPVTQEVLPTTNKIAEPPPQQTAPQMASSLKFVTAANASAVPMPSVEFDPNATSLDLGTTMGTFNSNFASTGTGSVMMFGKQIKGRSISVVMDVSGSMTDYLPIVAKELDKVAPGSNLVLFSGCGLLREPDNVDRELYTFAQEGKRFEKQFGPEIFQQMSQRKKTYIIKARNINHAQTALLSRRAMMADTVYWFADFQDAVDMGVMNELVDIFKAKNKKIYIHAVRRGNSFDPVSEHLVKPLGGEVIESKVK